MKPIEQSGNLTEIALSSCAKIKLTGTSSIDLSNTFPMSRNRGLQTTPYSLTVTSYCDSYVGFNLYIATLSNNTLSDSNIHYILIDKENNDDIVEGILSDATNAELQFTDSEKNELNVGLKGTYASIYKIHNSDILMKGSKQYDLYLFVDENATIETNGELFVAGVAVKAYDRKKPTIDSVCTEGQNLKDCIISLSDYNVLETFIYHHDSTLSNGAGDNSYRYAGSSEKVNNFVCFGSSVSPCPTDNLYRIIGVINDKVKLIKYDYMTTEELGSNGDYLQTYKEWGIHSTYKGTYGNGEKIGVYYWNYKATDILTNAWSTSLLNKINLNTNYINHIGEKWAIKIATTTWKVGGNSGSKIGSVIPSVTYQNEIVNPSTTSADNTIEYEAKIGLMYVSDYEFAACPEMWTLLGYDSDETKDYRAAINSNWMYMGLYEWAISRYASNSTSSFLVNNFGSIGIHTVDRGYAVRSVFNLTPDVTYKSGSGTLENPIILS